MATGLCELAFLKTHSRQHFTCDGAEIQKFMTSEEVIYTLASSFKVSLRCTKYFQIAEILG